MLVTYMKNLGLRDAKDLFVQDQIDGHVRFKPMSEAKSMILTIMRVLLPQLMHCNCLFICSSFLPGL